MKWLQLNFPDSVCDNFFIGESLCEQDHGCQVALREPPSELGAQFCRQCLQNLLSVLGALFPQDFPADPGSDLPVERGERCVHRCPDRLACGDDQPAHLADDRNVGVLSGWDGNSTLGGHGRAVRIPSSIASSMRTDGSDLPGENAPRPCESSPMGRLRARRGPVRSPSPACGRGPG